MLTAQYEDTITELSQDASELTASAQALREDNSALNAGLETARAETDQLQAIPISTAGLHCPAMPEIQFNRSLQSGQGLTHVQSLMYAECVHHLLIQTLL